MKILVIDDHILFREGILLMLKGLNIEITSYEAGSFEAAKKVMQDEPELDLILLDLGLPDVSGLEALVMINKQLPNSNVVVLSATDDHSVVEQALNCGAKGYIPKSSTTSVMLSALQLVMSGGVYIPPEILQRQPASNNLAQSRNLATRLTSRQYEVLQYLAEGKTNKEIGFALSLSESTVRVHVAAILKALNVKNRTQAVHVANRSSKKQVG